VVRIWASSEVQRALRFESAKSLTAGKLAAELVCESDVVLLEHTRSVGFGIGSDDRAVVLAGERVGRVVDAGELNADGDVEVGLDRREGHRVEHDRL